MNKPEQTQYNRGIKIVSIFGFLCWVSAAFFLLGGIYDWSYFFNMGSAQPTATHVVKHVNRDVIRYLTLEEDRKLVFYNYSFLFSAVIFIVISFYLRRRMKKRQAK